MAALLEAWRGVNEVSVKAVSLYQAGHYARAVDKLNEALEAAAAAHAAAQDGGGVGAQDCLVMASLRLLCAQCIFGHRLFSFGPALAAAAANNFVAGMAAFVASEANHQFSLAHTFEELLPEALATLSRRKAAGTLLKDGVLPHEAAWHARAMSQGVASGAETSPECLVAAGPHIGVAAFSMAGFLALQHVDYAIPPLSAEQQRTRIAVVVEALSLVALPRDSDNWLGAEASLLASVREWLAKRRDDAPSDGWRVLDAAWKQLLRSRDVLERRGLLFGDGGTGDDAVALVARLSQEATAVATAAGASPGRRACAFPGCGAREAHPSHFKLCAACKTVKYCSKAHQAEHWPRHKKACKAAREAAAKSSANAAA
jgi:hypothetical protein